MKQYASQLAIRIAALFTKRLQVVIYHRVVDKRDEMLPTLPTVDEFSRQISWLNRNFNILPIHDAVKRLGEGRLPPRSACITFDDGYKDNLYNAVPVLRKHGVSATFFVTTAYVEGGLMWNDRVIEAVRACRSNELDLTRYGLARFEIKPPRWVVGDEVLRAVKYFDFEKRDDVATKIFSDSGAVCNNLMMNADEIAEMHAVGMEIGGHTHRHPILKQLSLDEARSEIRTNKEILESIIQAPVRSFAYPNGSPGRDYDASHIQILKELNFSCAVSTAKGAAPQSHDPYQIPRFTPWGRSQFKYDLAMARNSFRNPAIVS